MERIYLRRLRPPNHSTHLFGGCAIAVMMTIIMTAIPPMTSSGRPMGSDVGQPLMLRGALSPALAACEAAAGRGPISAKISKKSRLLLSALVTRFWRLRNESGRECGC